MCKIYYAKLDRGRYLDGKLAIEHFLIRSCVKLRKQKVNSKSFIDRQFPDTSNTLSFCSRRILQHNQAQPSYFNLSIPLHTYCVRFNLYHIIDDCNCV